MCQRSNSPKQNIAPLQPLAVVAEPWEWVALGPLPRTRQRNRYLLTAIDLSTRFPEAISVKTIDAEALVDPLFSIFSQHGIPSCMPTDQGSNFTSHLFRHLCKKIGITHLKTTPYRPQTNGYLERFHRTYKTCLDRYPKWS